MLFKDFTNTFTSVTIKTQVVIKLLSKKRGIFRLSDNDYLIVIMINIDFNKLNPLEKKINETLITLSKTDTNITITKAAQACDCSMSKISKFVKKLGFNNYKQYMDFLYGKSIPENKSSIELQRIKNFIDDFDISLVDEFIELINSYKKIILFGYGPSFICTQYFEYKLRINTNKFVIAVPDEISAESLIDDKSLLVIFSTTGKFKSFERINSLAKEKGCQVLLIVEEYNASLLTNYNKVFWMSKFLQPDNFKPYEKSRIVFFIFIEEVIRHIIFNNRQEILEQKQINTEQEDI
ncbi:MurR/RpiR family transcriptional regulator [Clostridium sp.]|uniref:MurR/RpiR family transcriptional regulator n=1 Tax=Clostridium sp. TaxID=1506 RepID=UPI003D6C9676